MLFDGRLFALYKQIVCLKGTPGGNVSLWYSLLLIQSNERNKIKILLRTSKKYDILLSESITGGSLHAALS